MKIVVCKLSSGEEVIAREQETLSGFKYEKPRVIQMMQTQQGMSAGLVPLLISAPDDTVELNANLIVCKVTASRQIEDAYLQQTSGIDLSGKM